jgi:hypothetical protein
LNFPLSQSEVIDQVQAAILSGTYEPLASRLARANEAGCPLN